MIKAITSTLFLLILTLSMIKVSFSQSASEKSERAFYDLCHKANRLMESDLDSAYYYAEKATTIAEGARFWDAYFLKGLILFNKKEYSSSINSYKIALSYAKPDLILYTQTNIANTLYEAGYLDKAKALASYVVSVDSSDYKYNAIGILAKIHGKLNQLDSSEYFFSKAINTIPESHNKNGQITAGFLVAQADMYSSFGKLDTAISMYKESLILQQIPYKHCEVQVSLAKCFFLKKRYKDSQKYLERVFDLKKIPLYCHVKALQVKLEMEHELREYKKVRATCQALSSLMSTTNVGKKLRAEVAGQIQEKLIFLVDTKDKYLNRVVFALIVFLPLTLLVRLLFKLTSGVKEVNSKDLRISYKEDIRRNELKEARSRRIGNT